jgi:cytochrome P450
VRITQVTCLRRSLPPRACSRGPAIAAPCCRRRSTAAAGRALPFRDAVVHESLRCFPPVASGVARKLPRDVDVNGTVLPKDALALLPIWAVHYSEATWGPSAGEWRPARWLEGRSVSAVKKDEDGNPRWLPFQHGGQSCIGQHLAMVRAPAWVWLVPDASCHLYMRQHTLELRASLAMREVPSV